MAKYTIQTKDEPPSQKIPERPKSFPLSLDRAIQNQIVIANGIIQKDIVILISTSAA
jgi:hypothetical protein